ncbi:MAG: glycosyltransferase family 4 protein, partial [Oscillospiraceae bacterium]
AFFCETAKREQTVKFIFFSAQYLPTVGGVERYTQSLAAQLIKKGHSAVVVTSALEGLAKCETDDIGIKIYRLPVVWLMDRRFPVPILGASFRKLRAAIVAEKPDFGVIQTRFYLNSLFGAQLCSSCHIPSVVIDHSTAHLLSGGIVGFLGQRYEHFAAAYLKKRVSGFYGVSKRCGEWLEHFGIKAKGVLYNCVDMERIDKLPKELRAKLGIAPQAIVVIYSGRMVREKGVLKLLTAFENMGLSAQEAVLIIAGSGEAYEQVKKRERDNIRVLGAVPFERAIGLYKMADIFCLPTDYPEGFPTTVLEAAACHTMVIATDKGGTREVIQGAEYGILLKENTVEELERELERAMRDTEYRERCQQNSFGRVEQEFVWEKCCDKLLRIAKGL